jgi:2-polyprenyl-3-methyl-5-hydroxy-6-metoxy-1,4-benzoquinol methylase
VNVVDRAIRDRRITQAIAFIPDGSRVLDVGCDDGALFQRLGAALREGLGLDPALAEPVITKRYRLISGTFPNDAPDPPAEFDVITMLAVLEHLEPDAQKAAAEAAYHLLAPGGRLVATVPQPSVDRLLHWLIKLHVLDGMEPEQHHGFEPAEVVPLMEGAGLRLVDHRRFELRLNHLFVFERLK